MNSLLLAFLCFLFCALICEIPLRFAKIQSAFFKILFIHLVMGFFSYLLVVSSEVQFSNFFIFWAGAFLAWFGIRSHVESSILLRLLSILKSTPMTSAELVEAYEKQQGIAVRRDELIRGGLIKSNMDGFQLTPKGRLILAIASFLREPESQKEPQTQNPQ